MVTDAQAIPKKTSERREEVEARNNADSIAYQVERQIAELGDRVPMNEKARAEQLINEIRELVKNNSIGCCAAAPAHQRSATDRLGLSSAAYSQATSAGAKRRTGSARRGQ